VLVFVEFSVTFLLFIKFLLEGLKLVCELPLRDVSTDVVDDEALEADDVVCL